MAQFKGFGYQYPQNLQLALQDRFEQIAGSGNLDQNRLAIARQAASSLVPPEAVRKAAATEKLLAGAFKDSRSLSTGDEIEDQMNFLRMAQKAAIEADLPDIAIQATEQLSSLRVGQEERARLRAGEDREARGFEAEMQRLEFDTRMKAQKVLVDENNQPVMNVDISNPEDIATMSQELRDNPKLRLVGQESLFDFNSDQLLLQQKLEAERDVLTGEDSDIPVTTLNRFYDTASGQMSFAHSLDNMVDILGDDPEAFAAATSVEAFLQRAAVQGKAFAAAAGVTQIDREMLEGQLDRAGVTDARRRAAVMDLGYALATSREGGRLTDQDVERAIETLGFKDVTDPRVIVEVLLDRVTTAREAWSSRGEVAGIKYNRKTAKTYQTVDDVYAGTEERLRQLSRSLAGGQAQSAPAESPVTPAPAPTGALSDSSRATLFDEVVP